MSGFARRLQQGANQPQAVAGAVLAEDNFDRTNGSLGTADLGGSWSTFGTPSWVVASDMAAISATSGTNTWARASLPVSVTAGTAFCDMYLSGTSANTGVCLLANASADTYLNIQLNRSSTYDRIAISKRVNGTTTWLLQNDAAGLINGAAYSLAVVLTTSKVTVYLDGIQQLQYTFTAQDITDLSGSTYVGLRTWFGPSDDDGGSSWDRFLVTNSTSAPITRVPGAPLNLTATSSGSGMATISWTPGANGGSAIDYYILASSNGPTVNITDTKQTSYTFTGLNNVAQTFTLQAVNPAGASAVSASSNSVTPSAATVPDTPTSVTATAGDSQATVTWTAPASDGGSMITGYTVTSSPGNITTTSTATSAVVTGLTDGTSYTFTVTATNSIGTSAPSTASASITPVASTSGSGVNSSGTDAGENGWAFAGYRGPSNTGYTAVYDSGLGRNVQQSDLTTYTGSTTFNGGTYFRQIITGPITLTADTTFNQCLIQGPAGSSGKTNNYLIKQSGTTAVTCTMIDCEVNGNGQSGPDAAPYPSGYGYESLNTASGGKLSLYVLRCNMYGSTDIIKQANNSYIGYSWIHGNVHYYSAAGSGTHSDHVQIATGSCRNMTLEYSTFGTPKSVAVTAGTDWTQYEQLINAGLIQLGAFNTGATVTGITVRYNYANCGNFMFAGGVNSAAATCSGTFQGNRCGPYMRYGAKHGGFQGPAGDGTTMTFTGDNVYDDNFTAYWGGTYTKDQVFA